MKNTIFYLMASVLLLAACDEKFEKSDVTGVTVTESAVMLQLGEKAVVGATVEPAGASDVVWSSSDESVATVDQLGGITATGQGTASIIVTTVVGRKVASCAVYVNAIRVTRIELDKAALYMLPGDSAALVATVFPEDATNKNITWTSSDVNVAVVSDSGAVAAAGFGNATITATTEDGSLKATCLVTVSKVSVTGLLLSESAIEGTFGDEIQLEATILPDNATFPEVIWTSSDETMATVNADGLVKIASKEAGSAVIRATSKDNEIFWAECAVTVLPDQSGIVETVVYDKEIVMAGWSGATSIPMANFGELKDGDVLRLYFSNLGASPVFQIWEGDWGGQIVPEVRPEAGSPYYEVVLTADIIQRIMNPDWGSDAILVQGDGVTISKISVISTVKIQEETVREGELVLTWTAVSVPIANFGDNLVAGAKLRFYFSSLGGDPKMQLYFGDWEGQIVPENDPNYIVDVLSIPAGSTSYDVTLNAAMVQHMTHPAWGSDAMLIQGDAITISKITIIVP
ncbi:MAG: Ig-like domain-containing protein [Tannerella sp.]|jgi:uncharacterized protein YjdB|nr:Ig-like domain-containing protein [Tannerella sp.]